MSGAAGDWPDIGGRLIGAGHVLPVRVYYEDTDFSGLVYHAAYLRFMERGRSDFLRLRGVSHQALAAGEQGGPLAFAVRRMAIEFLRPARMDDLLTVASEVAALEGARIVLRQKVLRGGEALVAAEVTVAMVDPAGRPRRLPLHVRESLRYTGVSDAR